MTHQKDSLHKLPLMRTNNPLSFFATLRISYLAYHANIAILCHVLLFMP